MGFKAVYGRQRVAAKAYILENKQAKMRALSQLGHGLYDACQDKIWDLVENTDVESESWVVSMYA
jgi:hypothetical protein